MARDAMMRSSVRADASQVARLAMVASDGLLELTGVSTFLALPLYTSHRALGERKRRHLCYASRGSRYATRNSKTQTRKELTMMT